jgi:hypothetical protein
MTREVLTIGINGMVKYLSATWALYDVRKYINPDIPAENLPKFEPLQLSKLLRTQLSAAGLSIPRLLQLCDEEDQYSYNDTAEDAKFGIPMPMYKGLDTKKTEDLHHELTFFRYHYPLSRSKQIALRNIKRTVTRSVTPKIRKLIVDSGANTAHDIMKLIKK